MIFWEICENTWNALPFPSRNACQQCFRQREHEKKRRREELQLQWGFNAGIHSKYSIQISQEILTRRYHDVQQIPELSCLSLLLREDISQMISMFPFHGTSRHFHVVGSNSYSSCHLFFVDSRHYIERTREREIVPVVFQARSRHTNLYFKVLHWLHNTRFSTFQSNHSGALLF